MEYGKGQTSERMRAYHRAVRRQEPWATKIASKLLSDPMQGLLMLVYNRGRSLEYLTRRLAAPNPFLSLLPKLDYSWTAKLVIPELCKLKHGLRRKSKYRCHNRGY